LLLLNEEQRQEFFQSLLRVTRIRHEEFKKKIQLHKKSKFQNVDMDPIEEIQNFTAWLSTRKEPFTAIVDGPNAGHWGHNRMDYQQLRIVVDKLEAQNERPLVILPGKYLHAHSSKGRRWFLSPEDQAIVKDLKDSGKLYIIKPLCLDDHYWMAATLTRMGGASSTYWMISPEKKANGQLPGLRPMVVTNDLMRDHWVDLLEPRLFQRWKGSHMVHLQFSDDRDEIQLVAAELYSREIQGNYEKEENNNAKKSSKRRKNLTWHFPVAEWDTNERFCIRLPPSS